MIGTKSPRLSPITAIFLIVLVDILGFTIMISLLPFYAERFGATPLVVGALLSSYAICQLVSGPFLGRLSDRVGRKPLLIVSQVGTLFGFLLLAYSGSLFLVFVSRIIDGLTAGNISLAQAFISDVTAPKDRAKAFGKIGIAFGVGFLLGPTIAGALNGFGPAAPIFAAAGLSLTSILATIFLLPGKLVLRAAPGAPANAQPAARRPFKILDLDGFRRSVARPGLGVRFAQFFLFVLAFSGYVSGFPLFASSALNFAGHRFGAAEVSWVYAYTGLLGIIIQGGLMGRFVDRFGESTLTRFGFIGMAVGYGALSLTTGLPTVLFAVTFSGIGSSFSRPALTSLISRCAGKHEQGTVLGINQSMQSLAQIVAPLLSGFLIEHEFLKVWCFALSGVALFGIVLESRVPKDQQADRQAAAV
jgi:MFS family permease